MMRTVRGWAGVAMALAWLVPGASMARVGEPATTTLSNGLRVVVFPRPRLPIVQFSLMVPAGVADEPADAPGVASATAQLLLQGTASRSGAQYAAELETLGGNIAANAGRDATTFTGAFHARDFEAGIELLADAVLHPLFGDAELDQFRRGALEAVLQLRAAPLTVAEEELWAGTMRGHPYARPLFGTAAGMVGLTPAQLQAFHRDHIRPDRAVLAIAGDVTPEHAFAIVTQAFGSWAGTAVPPHVTPVPKFPLRSTVRLVDRPGPTAQIRIGLTGPARASPDFLPLQVAVQRLGALLPGAGTRDNDVRAGLAGLDDGGLLSIAASARADSAGAMLASLRAALTRLTATPPTDDELAPARHVLASTWPMGFESLGNVIGQWLALEAAHVPGAELDAFPAHVEAVTAAQVRAALQRWVDPARMVIVAVGPASVLRPQLARFGAVTVVQEAMPAAAAGPAAATPAASSSLGSATPEQRRRGRAVIAQAMIAHGGEARLRRVEDTVMEGDMTIATPEGKDTMGQLQQVRKDPWKMLLATRFMGFDTQQVLNGRRGWSRYAGDSVVVSDADSTANEGLRSGFSSDVVHLLRAAADPRARVAWRGRTTVAGRTTDIVEVDAVDAAPRRLYIDATNHRLLAMDQNEARPGSGAYTTRRIYKDYRQVSGVWWPHYEERLLAGQRVMTLTLHRVAVNTGVEDATFRKPATPEPGFVH